MSPDPSQAQPLRVPHSAAVCLSLDRNHLPGAGVASEQPHIVAKHAVPPQDVHFLAGADKALCLLPRSPKAKIYGTFNSEGLGCCKGPPSQGQSVAMPRQHLLPTTGRCSA